MAMGPSGGGGIRSEINVTPLVDVVLVLLIIFMVIIPILQMGYTVETPPKKESLVPPAPSADQIIVRLDGEGRMWINKELVARANFPTRLKSATTGR